MWEVLGQQKEKKNDGKENFISLILFCMITAPKWIRRVLLEEERVGRSEFPIRDIPNLISIRDIPNLVYKQD